MLSHKRARDKGKFSFSRYFQKLQPGDKVAVVRELSFTFGFENRIQGRTGTVLAKQGDSYCVEINDLNKPKKYVLKPIHLRKIETMEAKK